MYTRSDLHLESQSNANVFTWTLAQLKEIRTTIHENMKNDSDYKTAYETKSKQHMYIVLRAFGYDHDVESVDAQIELANELKSTIS
jgi:hypothetical protein